MEGESAATGGLEWFYLDSQGEEFGPFPAETMRHWYLLGYFSEADELLVRLPRWRRHVELSRVFPDESEAFLGEYSGPSPAEEEEEKEEGEEEEKEENEVQGDIDSLIVCLALNPAQDGLAAPGSPTRTTVLNEGCEAPPRAWTQQTTDYAGLCEEPPVGTSDCVLSPSEEAAAQHPGNLTACGPVRVFPVVTPKMVAGLRFRGVIKSFNAKQGFGFIESEEALALFGRDVFLHAAQKGDFRVGTEVTCGVELSKYGFPQARDLLDLGGAAPATEAQKPGGGQPCRGKTVRYKPKQ